MPTAPATATEQYPEHQPDRDEDGAKRHDLRLEQTLQDVVVEHQQGRELQALGFNAGLFQNLLRSSLKYASRRSDSLVSMTLTLSRASCSSAK